MPSFGAASSRWSNRSPRAKGRIGAENMLVVPGRAQRANPESRDDKARRFPDVLAHLRFALARAPE
jgi:hypothetical protein